MKLNKKDYAKLIAIYIVGFMLISFGGKALYAQLSGKNPFEHGFFDLFTGSKEETTPPPLLTPDEAEELYESRPEYPGNFYNEMTVKAETLLAKGNYSELDQWLYEASTTYKETPSSPYGYNAIIDSYRGALVHAIQLENGDIDDGFFASLKAFPEPRVLASVLLSAPAIVQVKVLWDQDSVGLPSLSREDREGLVLSEVEVEEKLELMAYFNSHRTTEAEFMDLLAYDFVAYDRTWQILIGMNQDLTYMPISIYITDNPPEEPITIVMLAQWQSFLSTAQLDKLLRDNFFLSLEGENEMSQEALDEALQEAVESNQ